MTTDEPRRLTRDEALAGFGAAMAASNDLCDLMTAREQAEAAWTPTYRGTVEDLEDRIRAERGLPAIDRGAR
jgi:hypothetical protein